MRSVLLMLTRWSPNTVIWLVWLPTGGKVIKVPFSCMMVLRSSARSVSIQSSFLGIIVASAEIFVLDYAMVNRGTHMDRNRTYLVQGNLIQHIASALNAVELARDPNDARVLFRRRARG